MQLTRIGSVVNEARYTFREGEVKDVRGESGERSERSKRSEKSKG